MNFNTTMAAFASEPPDLQEAVAELGPTVRTAYESLGELNDSLPAISAFSRALIPGVEQTQPTIDAVTPWIAQVQPFVSQQELGGLLDNLVPATASLALATVARRPVDPERRPVLQVHPRRDHPAGDKVMPDGDFTSGKPNYQEFWYAMVGLTGEGSNFDGNGQFVRAQTGGGTYPVTLKGASVDGGTLYGNSLGKPLGTKPAGRPRRPR